MGKNSGITLNLPSVNDLFSTEESRAEEKLQKVRDIPLSDIDGFPDHPFQVKEDESMLNMVESIKQFGVLTPAVARQKEDGRYELISGHRRKRACELAGLETLPTVVRQMSRDEAIIFMVDSNLQREKILPSEKAFSLKMRLEAMNRQAGRPSNRYLTPVVSDSKKVRTNEQLGKEIGESREQIRRYIRLTELVPEVLQMVDDSKIAFRPAVELSYLTKEEQKSLLDRLYEDHILGSVSELNYNRMMAKYQTEQQDIKKQIDGMEQEQKEITDCRSDAERITDLLAQYADFEKLTPAMLNTLIDRIEISEPAVVDGKFQQKIVISYRFVGVIQAIVHDSTRFYKSEKCTIASQQRAAKQNQERIAAVAKELQQDNSAPL